jgi:hypothetical protein
MSPSEPKDCGASYSNIAISGDAQGHLGNNYAEKIVNNYGGIKGT